ncbi:hypothetical protein [Polaromonas hydrogenivorans]|uniref:TolA protein n=1 Tax=Polaromonas hydrogenivorans TaxID=335476 RepID=A0AAU7LN38_9BURK
MKPFAFTFLLLWSCGFAGAQTSALNGQVGNIDAQRAAISAERSRLEVGFLTEDAACYKKFAVNSCLEKVNIRRREAMADLRRQEILLNDEERKIKGAQQIRKTEEKSSPEKLQEEADRRTKAAEDYQSRLEREKGKQQERGVAASNEAAAREANTAKLQAHQKKIQARSEQQAGTVEKAKEFDARKAEAQERRAQHEADQLKRVKPPAKPLPLPQ